MKVYQILIATFSLLSVVNLFANDIIQRDYWPTSDWRISEPEKQGMNSEELKKMDDVIRDNLPMTSSMTVVRHGYIVFEQSYLGESSELRNTLSVTKSVLSALIGIAVREGYIKSIDQKMIDFFPEYSNEKTASQVNTITLRHLLTLSDGIASFEHERSFSSFTLSRPLRKEPGAVFFYNNLSPQILSIIITRTTGFTALDFAKKYLFNPLGVSNIQWPDISGVNIGAFGIWLASRDMAKFGYLYLNKGLWEGKPIIPSEWITESTRAQIKGPDQFDYGFLWWIHSIAGYETYFAFGFGGQYIYVIPDLDIVVVITADNSDPSSDSDYLSLISSHILFSIGN